MATKTDIIKTAFDQLYADMGNDLKTFLSSGKIIRTTQQWKSKGYSPVGIKWALSGASHIFLLEVKPTELALINSIPKVKARFYCDKSKNLIEYKSTAHIGVSFLLNSEWGTNTAFNQATCDVINSFSTSGLYISVTDEAEMMSPKRTATGVGTSSSSLSSSAPATILAIAPSIPLNLILYGPPGTGKTYHTVNKALSILDPSTDWSKVGRESARAAYNGYKTAGQIEMTTFHQSMSYEDFVEGIKPVLGGSAIGYNIEPGIFRKISEAASRDPEKNYVLIIDEINRGNIANIFGELITLIEDDKRAGGTEAISIKLPYSKSNFSVPKNLYIIGTMNTADRSVEALDSALRRRFSFEEMMPDSRLLSSVTVDAKGTLIPLRDVLNTINSRVEALKDREHQIGHSYFMKFVETTPTTIPASSLRTVFTDKIIPLLQEYFYGDYEKILLVLGEGFICKDKNSVPFTVTSADLDMAEYMYSIKSVQDKDMADAILLLMKSK